MGKNTLGKNKTLGKKDSLGKYRKLWEKENHGKYLADEVSNGYYVLSLLLFLCIVKCDQRSTFYELHGTTKVQELKKLFETWKES